MPALAGCSPCGETWTGVGFTVEPRSIERAGGWRVGGRIRVDFDRPDDVPETVLVRNLDRNGAPSSSRRVAVQRDA